MNILRGAAGAAMALAAAGVLGGCATQVEGQAVPAANALDTSTAPSFSLPTTTPSASSSTELSVDVTAGECVALGGTVDDATIDYAVCGSPSSNYKVVDIVDASAMCPGDIDQTYYESFGGIEVGALCLDIDWWWATASTSAARIRNASTAVSPRSRARRSPRSCSTPPT